MKFGIQVRRGNISKNRKENPEKGRGLGHVTIINFGVHPNVSPKRVEVETSNLVPKCRVAMSQKPVKKNLDKKAQLSLTNPRDACEKFARFT